MVSYLPDYGVTWRSHCLTCGVMLCAVDIPIAGRYGSVVPANANYAPGRPTLHCKKCEKPDHFPLKDFEHAREVKR